MGKSLIEARQDHRSKGPWRCRTTCVIELAARHS